jgi:uncharacterized damage-inducible protein DinB
MASASSSAQRQSSGANPITASIKSANDIVKGYLTKSAEMVPAEKYGFRPVGVPAEVRTFGQLIGHIANANYLFCGAPMGQEMKGETGPGGVDFEKKTAKADLQKALADSFAFCDKAFAAVTDATGGQAVTTLPIGPTTKIGALAFNNAHDFEHYGNIVTYLRAMGMVPPSSQPAK